MTRKGLQHNPLRVMLSPMNFDTPEQEFAWAVGIFEGEGSFILGGAKRWPALQMKLGMTDEDVIHKASAILGLVVTGPYAQRPLPDGRPSKPMFRATKGGPIARAMIRKMLPYLGSRRRARAEELLRATSTGKRVRTYDKT